MSMPLFLKDMKNNMILLLVFIVIMSLYLSVIIYMYDPNGAGTLSSMVSILPVTVVNALGLSALESGLTGFIGSLFYGVLIYLFPMVYCIILGTRLVAKWVYDGSFSALLITPNSRVRIIVTQGVYMLVSIAVLFAVLTFVGVGVSNYFFSGVLDTTVFLKLNLCAGLMTMTVGMICFFFSCMFNDPKMSLIFGAGIPILFLILNILSKVSTQFQFLGNYSLYNMFNSLGIVQGGASIILTCVGFITIGLFLFAGGVGVFRYKRLSI